MNPIVKITVWFSMKRVDCVFELVSPGGDEDSTFHKVGENYALVFSKISFFFMFTHAVIITPRLTCVIKTFGT